jgi:hypothetical protein
VFFPDILTLPHFQRTYTLDVERFNLKQLMRRELKNNIRLQSKISLKLWKA